MPLQGWQTYAYDNTADAILYNSDRTAVRDDESDMFSPVVFIPSGTTATFEFETENMDNRYWYWCWGDDVELSAGAYYRQNRQQISFTDQGATTGNRRKYTATFTPSSDVYMTVNYAEQYWVYNPRLYLTSTGLASKSEINQSANSLGFYLYDQLNTTGVKIRNHTIDLKADKVTFSNSAGTVRDKIWIDPTEGTLHAVNGSFEGTVNASMFYNNAKSVSGEYTIDLENDPHNMFVAIETTALITLPNPADYPMLELSFMACPTSQGSTASIGLATHDNTGRIVYVESGAKYWYKSVSVGMYSKVFKIMAIGNYWYVEQGTVSSGTL
jgi:hypothetical protein